MAVNVLMPALSPTMEKGKLAKWLKKEGDTIKSGDVLAEIETDKATMEVEAVDEGKLGKILVAEGTDDVAVNTPIAIIVSEGETSTTVPQAAVPQAVAPAVAAAAPVAAASPAAAAASSGQPAGVNAPVATGGRVFASPLARRVAQQKGVDLTQIAGSGPHGRIILKDVEQAKPQAAAPAGAKAPAAAPVAAAAVKTPDQRDAAVLNLFAPDSYVLTPHDSMRKTIARRLTESKQTVPHIYISKDCGLERLLALRERLNLQAPRSKESGPAWKISVNDFIVKALAMALMKVPDANVSWTDEAMVRHRNADIGVAVAIPGGLITPIVRQANLKSLAQIAVETKDLAARARVRKLKPEEYLGGTSSVSNLGMMNIKSFSAIVNPPQATILAIGSAERRPVVKGNEIGIEQQMTVTLSTDHRCVDGALGAELLNAFATYIEEPGLMLV